MENFDNNNVYDQRVSFDANGKLQITANGITINNCETKDIQATLKGDFKIDASDLGTFLALYTKNKSFLVSSLVPGLNKGFCTIKTTNDTVKDAIAKADKGIEDAKKEFDKSIEDANNTNERLKYKNDESLSKINKGFKDWLNKRVLQIKTLYLAYDMAMELLYMVNCHSFMRSKRKKECISNIAYFLNEINRKKNGAIRFFNPDFDFDKPKIFEDIDHINIENPMWAIDEDSLKRYEDKFKEDKKILDN